MSKHAEFEATLRDLPPFMIETLKFVKKAALQELKEKNQLKIEKGETLDKLNRVTLLMIDKDASNNFSIDKTKPSSAGALCVLEPNVANNCKKVSENAFNNLCLAESITNGEEPRFVCDANWIETIGADETQVQQFVTGYDQWKATFLKSVKWLLQTQITIKLKRNVSVPLGFRQMNPDGQYVDTIYFEENAWNKAFSKLQPSTKISEQSLWLLAYLFHTGRTKPNTDDGLQEICTFVGRSIEVRTDNALSALKIFVYNIELLKSTTIDTFDDFTNEKLVMWSFMYGNPQYLSRMLEKKPTLPFGGSTLNSGLFLAIHEDNEPLFDYLLTQTIIHDEDPANLSIFAINSMKFKNNDAYFFKLLAASKKSLFKFVETSAKLEDYSNLLQSVERRLVLQNPFIKKLSLGEETDRKDFLKKVKRTASITTL